MVGKRDVGRMIEQIVVKVLADVNEVLEENNAKWQAGYDALEARVIDQERRLANLERIGEDI